MMDEREMLACRFQTEARSALIKRVNDSWKTDRPISWSMSGIEYYPPWEECPDELRAPYYRMADEELTKAGEE